MLNNIPNMGGSHTILVVGRHSTSVHPIPIWQAMGTYNSRPKNLIRHITI